MRQNRKIRIYTYQELVTFLESLPEEGSIEYSIKIIELIEKTHPSIRHQLIKIIEESEKLDLKFNAYYAVCKLFVRFDSFTDFDEIVKKYEYHFSSKKLQKVLLSTYYKNQRDIDSLVMSLDYIIEARKDLPDNRGVLSQFADITCLCLEEGAPLKAELLDEAYESINKAIRLEKNYAKYYFVKGRLLAIKKEFNKAKEQVLKAIDLENIDKADYSIRIGNYKYYLLYIQALESSTNLKMQINESQNSIKNDYDLLQKQFKENSIKNVELLGFFAGILSLIISTSNIISKFNFKEAASLLLILAGILIIVFSMLRKMIYRSDFWKETLGIMSLGVLFIFSGFSFNYYSENQSKIQNVNTNKKNVVDTLRKGE